MSKYLKLEARTTSEWDSTNFLLVELREGFLDRLKHLINVIIALHEKEGINKIVVYGDNADFYSTDEDIKEEFCEVIEVENKNDLPTPEQSIRYGQMSISTTDITFKAYGKHTDEEFWGRVPNEFILNLVD